MVSVSNLLAIPLNSSLLFSGALVVHVAAPRLDRQFLFLSSYYSGLGLKQRLLVGYLIFHYALVQTYSLLFSHRVLIFNNSFLLSQILLCLLN